jgi:glucosamine-6-phosphate deaminase
VHSVQPQRFVAGGLSVEIWPSNVDLARSAAAKSAELIGHAITQSGEARILVSTGNSQVEFISALALRSDIEWASVDVFHLDEYVGMPDTDPASFRRWIKIHLSDRVHPRTTHYLAGDAPDLEAELDRYSQLLREAPIDVAFVGIGENGHIAFNDPHIADFHDPKIVKRVDLDEQCRMQQVGEGHFPILEAAPREAVTVTCPALMSANAWISCVPDLRKAAAVQAALEGPVSPACPASLIQTHPNAYLYLDLPSAQYLQRSPVKAQRAL